MIEPAICFTSFKEGSIMGPGSSSVDQVILPAHVWAHLSTHLQQQVVHLVARLAIQLILAEEEHLSPAQKETQDVITSITIQGPI
jgi:hypothetical protein